MKKIIALLILGGMFKVGGSVVTSWTKPVIATANGTGTLTEKINDGVKKGDTTSISITANAGTYALVSQTPTAPALDIASDSGVVTVTSGTIDYSTVTSFKLVVTATDVTAATATVTLLVNAAPTFSAHSSSPCIEDGAVAGTDLIDLTATDANSDSITYAITSGNTGNDFTITATGVVKVVTGKTLNMATTRSYTLVITATDNSSSPLVTSATVTATVSTTCSSANVDSSTPLIASTTLTATVSSTGSGAAAMAVTFITILVALIVSLP